MSRVLQQQQDWDWGQGCERIPGRVPMFLSPRLVAVYVPTKLTNVFASISGLIVSEEVAAEY